ncbi:hypothetical protein PR003_g33114 [Phytophthora rubi]|uniref:Uncharacterized protein n=1 Tax=Phytophthora rubi TaxID=129364 RepID=A0A6A4ATB1_9STRA|nr:hypothetical protein PR003_g33114 [Phytophthora rubi]
MRAFLWPTTLRGLLTLVVSAVAIPEWFQRTSRHRGYCRRL